MQIDLVSMERNIKMIPEFTSLLEKMKVIHEKKNKDYASQDNEFENFERSANIAEWFNNPVDKSFVNLIGIKLARLATLLNSGAAPNNESIGDSFLDLCTYCALWSSYNERKMKPKDGFSNPYKLDVYGNKQFCVVCGDTIFESQHTTNNIKGGIEHTICPKKKSVFTSICPYCMLFITEFQESETSIDGKIWHIDCARKRAGLSR